MIYVQKTVIRMVCCSDCLKVDKIVETEGVPFESPDWEEYKSRVAANTSSCYAKFFESRGWRADKDDPSKQYCHECAYKRKLIRRKP